MNEPIGMRTTRGEPVPLVGVSAKGKVAGLLFELTVEQRYRNATQSNVEAVYTFPLPDDAVLLALQVDVAGKTLAGVVVEKRAAERTYEQVLDDGHTAIMLERAGDGLLTANFGNLLAGEEAVIRYAVAQLLRFDGAGVRLTVPTVIAPRYGDPAACGLQEFQAPVHDLAVEYPFSLAIELRGALAGGEFDSPTHAIGVARDADRALVTLDAEASLDRDFVLAVAKIDGQSLAAVEADGDGYVALASFRVGDIGAGPSPMRLKILLDCSGSMAGDSIGAARRALQRVLVSFESRDYFSLTRFGSRVEHATMGLVAAGERTVRRVSGAIERIDADLGGTEMQRALEAVFAIDADGAAADVLLITDGEIWAADDLVARARSAKQRVFVIGVGSAPAASVLRRLATASGGACAFVAPGEDPETAIVRMVDRLRAPRVAGVDVAWPFAPQWSTLPPAGAFAGETVHAFARFAEPPKGDAAMRVHRPDGEAVTVAGVPLPAPSTASALARIATAKRLESLDDADERLALALRYSLLTERTNLLVVHERADAERADALPRLAQVPQMLAAGWGGVGSVRSMKFSLDVAEMVDFYEMPASPTVIRCPRRVLPPPPADAKDVVALLRELDRVIGSGEATGLPVTLADLASIGVPATALDALRTLVAAGHHERIVVEAFLAALVARAGRRRAGRRVLRALRERALRSQGDAEVRASVDAIVASMQLRPRIGERLLGALREAAD